MATAARGDVLLAVAAVLVILVAWAVWRARRGGAAAEPFWTQYGGAVPPDEQVRRFDAADVPDKPWAEAYWPPQLCAPRPPPVPGEPRRPPFA